MPTTKTKKKTAEDLAKLVLSDAKDEAQVVLNKAGLTREELISSVHSALNSFPVLVYNGEEKPKKVPLPEGIACISEDLRSVKTMTKENSILLTGIRSRKKIIKHFSDLWTLLKKTTIVRVLLVIAGITSMVLGLIQVGGLIIELIPKIF